LLILLMHVITTKKAHVKIIYLKSQSYQLAIPSTKFSLFPGFVLVIQSSSSLLQCVNEEKDSSIAFSSRFDSQYYLKYFSVHS